jgi:phage shock protein A
MLQVAALQWELQQAQRAVTDLEGQATSTAQTLQQLRRQVDTLTTANAVSVCSQGIFACSQGAVLHINSSLSYACMCHIG